MITGSGLTFATLVLPMLGVALVLLWVWRAEL